RVATASRIAWRMSGGIARSVAAAKRAFGETAGSMRATNSVGAVADLIIGWVYLPEMAAKHSSHTPRTPRVLDRFAVRCAAALEPVGSRHGRDPVCGLLGHPAAAQAGHQAGGARGVARGAARLRRGPR